MSKKLYLLCSFILDPIGIIEKYKKDSSPHIINIEYDMIEKNILYPINSLFEAIEKNIITIKNVGIEKIYDLKNNIAHLVKIFFITFKR